MNGKNWFIKIGWNNCKVEEQIKAKRCFRCHYYGHEAKLCNKEQLEKRCLNCGDQGHHAKECVKEQFCYVCQKTGHRVDGMKCPLYREAIYKLKEDKKGEKQKKTK